MSIIINPHLKDYYIMIGGDSATVKVQKMYFEEPYDFNIKVGNTKELNVIIEPPEAINYIDYSDIKWTSSNPKVASVDSDGIVTGLSEGKTKITVKIRRYTTSINCTVVDAIQFADENTKKLCLKLWDKNGDGELSYAEAAKVTFIPQIFANSQIKSFNELKYFKNVQSISPGAFQGCKELAYITFPKNIQTIGKQAFYDCDALTEITLPTNLKNIGYESFANCENLTYIVSPSKTPPKGSYMFGNDDPKLYSIKVPSSVRDIYCDDPGWSEYRSYINPTGFDYTFDFYLS